MVEQLLEREVGFADPLDAIFRTLADPTRRAMLRMLADGERSVGELAEPFEMSFAGAAKHVKVLEDAGLVRRTVRGRIHSCRLVTEPLAAADGWFDFYSRFWSHRLDRLEAAINSEAKQRGATEPHQSTDTHNERQEP
jgi:DNA-binding transcriptional ArsR family regulator